MTFFEKLCDTVEALNAKLPRYKELYDSLSQVGATPISSRLRDSLSEIYCLLFEFFSAVGRVFSKKDGRVRKTSAVVASLMWKPFDARFEVTLAKITMHADIVRHELQFAHLGDLRDAFDTEAVEMSRKHHESIAMLENLSDDQKLQARVAFRESVIRWLDTPEYKNTFEDACQEKTEGTNEWLFEDPNFARWYDDDNYEPIHKGQPSPRQHPASLLWINGKPGSGKTVLACSVVEVLSKGDASNSNEPPPVVCYYFFSHKPMGKNTLFDFLRATAVQIFHAFNKLEKITDLFAFALQSWQTSGPASKAELLEIISQCLSYLPNLHCVIDGVDECTENEALITQIAQWCRYSPLKAVLLSRPNIETLRRSVRQDCQVQLTSHFVESDILLYVELAVSELFEQGLLPEDMQKSSVISHLTQRAEGMFLWVRLMVSYLSSPGMTRSERRSIIMERACEGLDGLDSIYVRIQKRIESLNAHSLALARRALVWVAHTHLSSSELKEALYPDGWDLEDHNLQRFDHALMVVCCGLLEKDITGRFQFIHLTALDFAQQGSHRYQVAALTPGPACAKAMIVDRCLSYLMTDIPAQPLSGSMRQRAEVSALKQRWPLLEFATFNWISLCLSSLKTYEDKHGSWDEVANMIRNSMDFLEQQLRIMTWIEVLYTYEGSTVRLTSSVRDAIWMPSIGYGIEPGQQNDLVSLIKELIDDLISIDGSWGNTLRENPAEIWGDVAVFAKSRFLKYTGAGAMESLAPRLEKEEEEEEAGHTLISTDTPVFSISVSSADAATLGVLSIFPNKAFFKGWQDRTDIPWHPSSKKWSPEWGLWSGTSPPSAPRTSSDLAIASSGWLATYEAFSVGESRSESKIIVAIPLDADDIAACLRQSLGFSAGAWKCSFPLTIAPGLDKISILNNIIRIDAQRGTYISQRIPSESHPQLQLAWNPETIFSIRYSYQIYWSADSRYIAFTDNGIRHQTFLGLFSSGPLEEGLKLVNFVTMAVPREVALSNCTFHRTAPLFLYQSNNFIFLWEIGKVGSMPICFHKVPSWRDFIGYLQIEAKICFSACGKYITITHHGRPWPELMQVPAELLGQQHRLGKRPWDDGDGAVESKKRSKTAEIGSKETTLAFAKLPAVISAAVDVHQDSAAGISATMLQNNSTRELTILNGDTELTRTISVAKLPETIQMRSASSIVWLPSQIGPNSNAQCRLIITSKPEEAYCSDEPAAASHLPMVVRKDVRALEVKEYPFRLRDSAHEDGHSPDS